MVGNLVDKVKKLLVGSTPAQPTVTVIRRRVAPGSVPLPGQPGIRRVDHRGAVERDTRAVWFPLGWRQDAKNPDRYLGEYRKGGRFYRGEIVRKWNGLQPYIWHPSEKTLKGPHALCFRAERAGYYRVNLPTPAQSVEEAIHAVELVLLE